MLNDFRMCRLVGMSWFYFANLCFSVVLKSFFLIVDPQQATFSFFYLGIFEQDGNKVFRVFFLRVCITGLKL